MRIVGILKNLQIKNNNKMQAPRPRYDTDYLGNSNISLRR